MARKTAPDVIARMQEMYDKNVPVPEIARALGVSYRTAYGYTAGRKKGHASTYDYQKAVAGRQGHATIHGYQTEKVRARYGIGLRDHLEALAKERGFASDAKYRGHLASERQQRPEYQCFATLVEGRLKSLRLTQEWLAKQLEVTPQSVNGYVQGKTMPKGERKRKLLDILGIELQELEDIVMTYTERTTFS